MDHQAVHGPDQQPRARASLVLGHVHRRVLDWWHHAQQLGVWFWRPTVWWNPDGAVSPAERAWLEEKYPGWEARFGTYWTRAANIREGRMEQAFPETLPILCNMCQLPIVNPYRAGDGRRLPDRAPEVQRDGRTYQFCCDPCKWIFDENPSGRRAPERRRPPALGDDRPAHASRCDRVHGHHP